MGGGGRRKNIQSHSINHNTLFDNHGDLLFMVCVLGAVRKVAEGGGCDGVGHVGVRGQMEGRGWAGEGRGEVRVGGSITGRCSGPSLTAHLHALDPFTNTAREGGEGGELHQSTTSSGNNIHSF